MSASLQKKTVVRPETAALIRSLSKKYIICIVTSMTTKNAEECLKTIMSNWRDYIQHIFGREYTTFLGDSCAPLDIKSDATLQHYFRRDTEKMAKELGVESERLIFVDNSAEKYNDCDRVVIVSTWDGSEDDRELERLKDVL